MKTLSTQGRPAELLLVDDNDNDVELTKSRSGRPSSPPICIMWKTAKSAWGSSAEGKYANAPTADIILLDLNMPRMDGREVVEAISADDDLKHLPVIILTTSEADEDILTAYRLRCSSFIVKPVGFENFAKAVQVIGAYWFTLVVLPPDPRT